MRASAAPKAVAVAGATGRLGSIVGVLLERGHSVRAITREPRSEVADGLRRRGAEVVFGDFDEPASLVAAAAGADALFATGTAHRAGPDGELRHGHGVAAAAAEAGVGHLVYVSGDGADPASPLPLFRAKFAVEERIREVAVPHTILAPTYLMENLFNPWNLPILAAARLPSPIAVDRPLQQTAIADMVALAARAIERPDEFAGRRIAIASDELTAVEAAASLGSLIGRELEAVELDRGAVPRGLAALFGWLEETGHSVDIAALRRRHSDVGWHGFAEWARSQRERLQALCPRSLAAR